MPAYPLGQAFEIHDKSQTMTSEEVDLLIRTADKYRLMYAKSASLFERFTKLAYEQPYAVAQNSEEYRAYEEARAAREALEEEIISILNGPELGE